MAHMRETQCTPPHGRYFITYSPLKVDYDLSPPKVLESTRDAKGVRLSTLMCPNTNFTYDCRLDAAVIRGSASSTQHSSSWNYGFSTKQTWCAHKHAHAQCLTTFMGALILIREYGRHSRTGLCLPACLPGPTCSAYSACSSCRMYGVEFLGTGGKIGPTAQVGSLPVLTYTDTSSPKHCWARTCECSCRHSY
jgi:hypothetical protein